MFCTRLRGDQNFKAVAQAVFKEGAGAQIVLQVPCWNLGSPDLHRFERKMIRRSIVLFGKSWMGSQ